MGCEVSNHSASVSKADVEIEAACGSALFFFLMRVFQVIPQADQPNTATENRKRERYPSFLERCFAPGLGEGVTGSSSRVPCH